MGTAIDGVPRVGVLGCPNLPAGDGGPTGCLFVAERGGGAWEVYWTDPGVVPDSSKWRTQLFMPIEN